MGNEQSASGPSNSPSTFSFLNRTSVKKPKGIVVVRDGNTKQLTLEDDPVYKRFQEIPKFLPIMRSSIGKKETQSESLSKVNPRPIFRFACRLQEHFNICSKTVVLDQANIEQSIKEVDNRSAALATGLQKKKISYENFVNFLSELPKLKDEVMAIQLLLEELVPVAETLNELFLPADRLPKLNLGKVLVRTPVSSSDGSLQSTPRREPTIHAIEEIRVVDTP